MYSFTYNLLQNRFNVINNLLLQQQTEMSWHKKWYNLASFTDEKLNSAVVVAEGHLKLNSRDYLRFFALNFSLQSG